MWQERIIVPSTFRKTVLSVLHDGHPGIWAMRALSRFYVWWPGIDKDVENHVKQCNPCQQNRPREPETLLYSWCAVTGNLVRGNFGPGPKLSLKFLVRADQYSR